MVMMVIIASNRIYGDDGGYCHYGDDCGYCHYGDDGGYGHYSDDSGYCHYVTMVVMVWSLWS